MPSVLEALQAAFPDAVEEVQPESQSVVVPGEVVSDSVPSVAETSLVDTYKSHRSNQVPGVQKSDYSLSSSLRSL